MNFRFCFLLSILQVVLSDGNWGWMSIAKWCNYKVWCHLTIQLSDNNSGRPPVTIDKQGPHVITTSNFLPSSPYTFLVGSHRERLEIMRLGTCNSHKSRPFSTCPDCDHPIAGMLWKPVFQRQQKYHYYCMFESSMKKWEEPVLLCSCTALFIETSKILSIPTCRPN